MILNWKIFLNAKKNKLIFIFSFITLALVLISFLHFLTFNENREGFVFNDPILNLYNPKEISVFTFALTYILAISGIVISLKTPQLFIRLIQAYLIMTIFRMLCLFMFPLEAPKLIIPLKDIFLENTFYSGRENLKDLFFSGHTATIFLFGIYFDKKELKFLYFLGSLTIGIMLMIQHVHYSIDVAAAPIVAILASIIQKKIY